MDVSPLGPSLLEAFTRVPDRREARGRRHPLPAMLALSVVAMLCGARSLYAIAQWGRLQSPETVRALGFTRDRTPSVSTLHLVFKEIDAAAFEAVLGAWVQSNLGSRATGIAIDGKALKSIHNRELPGVRLVATYSEGAGVLAQAGGEAR